VSELDPIAYRRVLSHFATGVTVVATKHVGGGVCGLTVNAFTSVSLSPPMVLVCIDRASNTYACIKANGTFTASFLGSGQHDVSVRFAQRAEDKFREVPHRLATNGAPVVDGSVGHVECVVVAEYPGGDHQILLARVAAGETGDGFPLVFFRGGYSTLAGPIHDDEESPAGRGRAARSAEADLQEELAGELEGG
jgi:flavin reductase (DIM6/NTAB) family NADH-FMN oxidoreductase RutF